MRGFSPDRQTAFSSSFDLQGDVIQWRITEWSLDELRRPGSCRLHETRKSRRRKNKNLPRQKSSISASSR
jgi:hypothetical protein